jgi:hypothetical protein
MAAYDATLVRFFLEFALRDMRSADGATPTPRLCSIARHSPIETVATRLTRAGTHPQSLHNSWRLFWKLSQLADAVGNEELPTDGHGDAC